MSFPSTPGLLGICLSKALKSGIHLTTHSFDTQPNARQTCGGERKKHDVYRTKRGSRDGAELERGCQEKTQRQGGGRFRTPLETGGPTVGVGERERYREGRARKPPRGASAASHIQSYICLKLIWLC